MRPKTWTELTVDMVWWGGEARGKREGKGLERWEAREAKSGKSGKSGRRERGWVGVGASKPTTSEQDKVDKGGGQSQSWDTAWEGRKTAQKLRRLDDEVSQKHAREDERAREGRRRRRGERGAMWMDANQERGGSRGDSNRQTESCDVKGVRPYERSRTPQARTALKV